MAVVGIDGCRSGWFFVRIEDDGAVLFGTEETIASLWERCRDASLCLIDIPVGLPAKEGRRCDRDARKILGRRFGSCVFPPPCRAALDAADYAEACRINKAVTGKKLSLQTWHIVPKIREVDAFLRRDRPVPERLLESHPEVCFRGLSGGRPLSHAKRTEAGIRERLEILKEHLPQATAVFTAARQRYLKKEAADDDIVDALALAVSARFPAVQRHSIPADPPADDRGLPMQIVYAAKRRMPVSDAQKGEGRHAKGCLFCRWVRSKKPVDRSGSMAAFEDGNPVTDGHMLIVPLRHTPDFFSLSPAELRDGQLLIHRLARELKAADPSITGFNIGVNCGASAGQTVFHAHIHLIPRREGDTPDPRGGVRGVIPGKRSY